ncbi:unnamed protein product, partial [Alternaria alternata]
LYIADKDDIKEFFYLLISSWINLCGQSSIYSLEREMETFATDLDTLDKAYSRIMQTIIEKPVAA